MNQKQSQHDSQDFRASEPFCGDQPTMAEEDEGGVGHRVDEIPQALEIGVGFQQTLSSINSPSAPIRLLIPISRPAVMMAGKMGMNTSEKV